MLDLRKKYKDQYSVKLEPSIVNIPKINYITVKGNGNPNEENGMYQKAVSMIYAVAYTLKMSYKSDYKIKDFEEYVVPPLEGFWWQNDIDGVDYSNKDIFNWISVMRLPDFITENDFNWAKNKVQEKKKIDCNSVKFTTIEEGLCVQVLHIGPFDDEPRTVNIMNEYIEKHGYINDFNEKRIHHEIYLSDARKQDPSKWKTIIRHPIKIK